MALSAKTNQLTGPAATGNQSSTDPGFTPKALLMWAGLQTAAGAAADAQFSLGAASDGASEFEAGYNSDDAVTTSDVVRNIQTANRILRLDTAGLTTENVGVNFTSFDASGFSNNWVALTTTSPKYNYLALGGTDITNVFTGNYAMNTSAGNQSVTGVGFQPDIVIFWGNLATAASSSNNNNQTGVGVMDAAGNQWAITQKAQNNVATSNTNRAFSNVACYVLTTTVADSFVHKQSFVSMDTDGFTVSIDTALGTASLINFIAIKGGSWKVGTETQKTSTGTKATAGVGFTPSGVLFGSVCDTTTDAVSTNARLSWGASTGASNNVAVWTGDQDNVADTIANTIMSATKCIVHATEATSASPTTQAEANMSSLDSDGFTLDWTTADATARVFGYVAFGASGVVANKRRHSLPLTGVG